MKINYFKYKARRKAFDLLTSLTINKGRVYWPIVTEGA